MRTADFHVIFDNQTATPRTYHLRVDTFCNGMSWARCSCGAKSATYPWPLETAEWVGRHKRAHCDANDSHATTYAW
jgi:hypothetical protein